MVQSAKIERLIWFRLNATLLGICALALVSISMAGCSMDSVPIITLKVHVAENQQSDLEQFLIAFADERGFEVRDHGRESGLAGGRRVSSLRFVRADGIAMGLGDYLDGRRFWVAIYDDRETGEWRDLYEELKTELISRWPDTKIEHSRVQDHLD